MSTNTCDCCTHYTAAGSAPGSRTPSGDTRGRCALAGDINDIDGGNMPADSIAGWDHEGCSAGVYVGPKFGCIHWVAKA